MWENFSSKYATSSREFSHRSWSVWRDLTKFICTWIPSSHTSSPFRNVLNLLNFHFPQPTTSPEVFRFCWENFPTKFLRVIHHQMSEKIYSRSSSQSLTYRNLIKFHRILSCGVLADLQWTICAMCVGKLPCSNDDDKSVDWKSHQKLIDKQAHTPLPTHPTSTSAQQVVRCWNVKFLRVVGWNLRCVFTYGALLHSSRHREQCNVSHCEFISIAPRWKSRHCSCFSHFSRVAYSETLEQLACAKICGVNKMSWEENCLARFSTTFSSVYNVALCVFLRESFSHWTMIMLAVCCRPLFNIWLLNDN